MAELTIEQKAKRYDEAIEQLRIMMPNWENLSYNGKTFIQDLVYILPELKESEDVKIIKALIEFFKLQEDNTTYSFVSKKDILAWLDKQLGKQGEQKPADNVQPKQEWSMYDETILNNLIEHFKNKRELIEGEIFDIITWLKHTKDRLQPQNIWKPTATQMITLRQVISGCSYDIEPLVEIEEQLKVLQK